MNNWKHDEIGSFELFINNFDEVSNISNDLYENTSSDLDVIKISEKFPDIFNWIALFDMNILVIIIIMILVGGINMITALLVTILERTQLIGVLKVLGSKQTSIRNIFISNGVYLISLGLFFGNLIGVGLVLFQKVTGFVKLDPQTYYVSEVPLDLNFTTIILLNLGVLFLCFAMLIIPSFIIGRISPTDSLKIN
jgi:lipoprotein-releasing system permease protein